MHYSQEVTPPEKFGIVEAGVYRSNALYEINIPFLKQLEIKTVLYLSPDTPVRAIKAFFDENNINFIELGIRALQPKLTWKPVSEELIKEGLEIVLNVTNHPIVIICSTGIHQTGTLVACLRRLQNWNITSILDEYKRYAGTHTRYFNEQFIELFDVDLVTLPTKMPKWFIEQQKMMLEEQQQENETIIKIDELKSQPVGISSVTASHSPMPIDKRKHRHSIHVASLGEDKDKKK